MATQPPGLSAETTRALLRAQRAGGAAGRRASIILLADRGWTDVAIAEQLGIARQTVARWRHRYTADDSAARTLDRLSDAPRSGRPAVRDTSILVATASPPPDGEAWSVVSLAASIGLSAATVRRVWRHWGITRNGRLESRTRVLPGEIERFGGLYLNADDAAFAYRVRSAARTEPAPFSDPGPYESLLDRLNSLAPRDDCFPEQRDLEFEEFLDQLDRSQDGSSTVRIVVADQQMTDSDLITAWATRAGLELGAPQPPITWDAQLEAVIAGCLGPPIGPELAIRITERIAEVRGTERDFEPIRWLP